MLMQVVTAVAAARAVYDSEDRDEHCSCAHEDHTPGNGCESRWCVCRWWHKEED